MLFLYHITMKHVFFIQTFALVMLISNMFHLDWQLVLAALWESSNGGLPMYLALASEGTSA